jgi:hypothetical protein
MASYRTLQSMRYFIRQNLSFILPVPPALLPEDFACWISRELWWTNKGFSLVNIISPWFSTLIYNLRDKQ